MLLFVDGFAHYTTALQKWSGESHGGSGSAAPTVAVGLGRNGSGGLRLNGGSSGAASASCWMDLPSSSTWVAGCAFLHVGSIPPVFRFQEGAAIHVDVRMDSLGHVAVTRNGTTIATSVSALEIGSWNFIELKATIHSTTGYVELRINGAVEATFTGNTRNGGTGVLNRFMLGNVGQDDPRWSDIYVLDGSGTMNNDFLGDVKIETLRPSAAGSYTQFTPLAGANWENADDSTPDDDATYNASATAGQKDSFALTDLATAAGSVIGVQQNTRWRKDDAGSRTARALVRVASTDAVGPDLALGDTFTTARRVIEQNPVTAAAWTIAEVDALEAGYELVS